MTNTKHNESNAFKQALENRKSTGLSSNFTYRMMEHIRIEAQKQRKRRKITALLFPTTASLSLIGLAVYSLVYRLGFNPANHLPHLTIVKPESALVDFYSYIAVLTFFLLALDYYFRRKRKA